MVDSEDRKGRWEILVAGVEWCAVVRLGFLRVESLDYVTQELKIS